VLGKFEATIRSLENSRDLSSITLTELVNALQAQEQRRLMMQEGSLEGAFQAKNCNGNKYNQNNNSHAFSPCPYCRKNNHPHKCWWRPDVKCNKCGQSGHVEKICKSHYQHQEVQVAEEQLFTTTCFTTNNPKIGWLLDSGCTNHMAHDWNSLKISTKLLFPKNWKWSTYCCERHRNSCNESHSGLKLIFYILFVP